MGKKTRDETGELLLFYLVLVVLGASSCGEKNSSQRRQMLLGNMGICKASLQYADLYETGKIYKIVVITFISTQ